MRWTRYLSPCVRIEVTEDIVVELTSDRNHLPVVDDARPLPWRRVRVRRRCRTSIFLRLVEVSHGSLRHHCRRDWVQTASQRDTDQGTRALLGHGASDHLLNGEEN